MALLVSAPASAQTVVRWTAKIDPAAQVKAGAGLEVVLDARIDPGWHLYAITQEKGGPQPLVIAVPPTSPFRLTGNVIAPLPITAPDANFNIETQYHAEEATFYVPLAVPAGATGRTPLDLDVTFQTCTDRFCLPPATERVSLVVARPRHRRRRDVRGRGRRRRPRLRRAQLSKTWRTRRRRARLAPISASRR